jgi:hypothetical protein
MTMLFARENNDAGFIDVFSNAAADLCGILVSLSADLEGEKLCGQFHSVLFFDCALGPVGVPDYPGDIFSCGHG